MHVNVLADAVKYAEATFDWAAVNYPDLSIRELFEEVLFRGTHASQTRHLGNSASVQLSSQVVCQLSCVGTARAGEDDREFLRHFTPRLIWVHGLDEFVGITMPTTSRS